ncbi:MAG: glucose-1-phosphate cytidylyltransferase [Solirubrobacteraceae bacterium]
MKTVILAGGTGTRLSEETSVRPKPMVEIGGRPMLWHIMKHYAAHGLTDFVVCLGYRGDVIKDYFASFFMRNSDVTIDLSTGQIDVHASATEPWRVTLVDTGAATLTGGRLKRALAHVGDEQFCMTYGDGVADVDLTALVAFHREQGTLATVTSVQPPGRFGALDVHGDRVTHFREKPRGDGTWTNGGFFVLDPGIGDYIEGDATTWEEGPLRRLAHEGQLSSFRHEGYWQVMDTLRDKIVLQEQWDSGAPPWVTWR